MDAWRGRGGGLYGGRVFQWAGERRGGWGGGIGGSEGLAKGCQVPNLRVEHDVEILWKKEHLGDVLLPSFNVRSSGAWREGPLPFSIEARRVGLKLVNHMCGKISWSERTCARHRRCTGAWWLIGMRILRDAGPDAEQSERNRLENLNFLID